MGQQVLLDTTVLIAGLSERDIHHREAREIFMENGQSRLTISSVTLTEALIRPFTLGKVQGERAEITIRALIRKIIPFTDEHAALAAKIRSTHKAKIPDSMIIATAVLEGIRLITFDRKMMGLYERIK